MCGLSIDNLKIETAALYSRLKGKSVASYGTLWPATFWHRHTCSSFTANRHLATLLRHLPVVGQ